MGINERLPSAVVVIEDGSHHRVGFTEVSILRRSEHESPVHDVRITKAFYISIVPVTQAQYEAVKGK